MDYLILGYKLGSAFHGNYHRGSIVDWTSRTRVVQI